MLKLFRSLTIVALLGGILSAGCILGLRSAAFLEPLELTIYDWLFRVKPEADGRDPRVVLLGVTEQDIRNQGRWPITDATLAEALKRLVRAEPRAIGLDIYRDIEVPPGRQKLDALLASSPHIVSVTKLGGGQSAEIPPPPILAGSDQVGFNDVLADSDGIVRRGLLFQDHGEDVAYAFALRLAILYLAVEDIYPEPDPSNELYLRLGPTTLKRFEGSDGGYAAADAGGYQFLLNYQGPHATAETFSLTALLSGQVDPEVIRDKIVLIGVVAESVPDRLNTPYGMTHGVDVHAHLISQFIGAGLDGRAPIHTIDDVSEQAWVVIWSLAGAFFGLWARSAWRFVTGGVLLLILLVVGVVVAFFQGWWIPLVPPALAWFLSATVVTASVLQRERKERAVLRQLFGRHVSEEVAEALWQLRDQFLEGGRPQSRQLVATVLFTDFKGYTAVSEKMEPQALMDWINSYLDAMSAIVMAHRGFVDDYAGDAIKANFYNPLKAMAGQQVAEEEIAGHAANAVACALAMEQEMHRLNQHHQEQGLPTVGMRIGIHTGSVVAGSVGSAQRMKYTTVGDTVNTAARLESLDRDLVVDTPSRRPCRILIGETTLGYLRDSFRVEPVGEVSVKGKEHPITAYRVLSPWSETP